MSERTLMDCAQSALMYSEEDARIIADAAEEITRLRARVEVLEELLRPLADAAAHYDPMWDRDEDLEWSTRLTKGHLRKVLAALEAKP